MFLYHFADAHLQYQYVIKIKIIIVIYMTMTYVRLHELNHTDEKTLKFNKH